MGRATILSSLQNLSRHAVNFYLYFVIAGGIGETVCAAVAEETGITVRMLAVPKIPRSGPGDALLDLYGISAKSIIKTVKSL